MDFNMNLSRLFGFDLKATVNAHVNRTVEERLNNTPVRTFQLQEQENCIGYLQSLLEKQMQNLIAKRPALPNIITEPVKKAELTFSLMVNRFKAHSKEQAKKWIGAIKNNKAQAFKSDIIEMNLEELSSIIKEKHTIIPAILTENEKLEDSNWTSQQVFALDIDNISARTTINDLIARFKSNDIECAMVYTSFSHTEANPKYRMIFIADKVIYDYATAKQVTEALHTIAMCADEKCTDLSRIYFAGKEVIYKSEATFNADKLLARKELYNSVITTTRKASTKTEIVGREADGTDNMIFTLADLRKNLSAINEFRGKELDYSTSFEWINTHISLSQALGKKHNVLFRCLHKDHIDQKPSAMIYEFEGQEYYRCSSCKSSHFHKPKSTIDTLALLLDMSKVEIQYFLADRLGFSIGSEHQRAMRLLIAETQSKFNAGKLIPQDSLLYKHMQRSNLFGIMNILYDFALSNVPFSALDNISKRPVFFVSNTQVANEMAKNRMIGSSLHSVKCKIQKLKDLGFIRPITLDKINTVSMNKAINIQKKYRFKHRVEYYEICPIDYTLIDNANEYIKTRKELGHKYSGDNIFRRAMTFGNETVAKTNIQDNIKDVVNNSKDIKKYKKIIEKAEMLIEEFGYFTVDMLRKAFDPKRKMKKVISEKLIYDILPQIIKTLDIKKMRVTKAVKSRYSISNLKTNNIIYCQENF